MLLAQKLRQPSTTVLIKASDDSRYRDLVDALDEMAITDQNKYALVDLNAADTELLKRQGL
ncbi:hypothetical protein [Hymenobacter koreensis]|uniref:Uncharacterized protein n=1 Tax=Hymenobacter koreensis TaxID=1084523 RepID=A0ABP8JKP4_9BACT